MTTQTLPTKSQALVAEEMGAPFELVGIDLPSEEELHEDDVLVRFHASGICHTDIGSWSGAIPAPFPCILGHEGAGEVLAIGKRNKDQFKIGDHVVASFCSCGDCKACKRNEPACCEIFVAINLGLMDKTLNSVKISYTNKSNQIKQAHAKYFGQSSFGNVMAVTGRSLTRISKNVEPKYACALACGFQTGFSTVIERAKGKKEQDRTYDRYSILDNKFSQNGHKANNQSESFEDETLLVLGLGAVGLGALVAGKMLGFGKVIACDINPSRLELAEKEIGVDSMVNAKDYSSTEEFVQHIKKISKDERGSTLMIEASGVAKALKDGIMSLAVGGRGIVVGSPLPTAVLDIPSGLILSNIWTIEGVLMGNSNPKVTIPFLVDLVKEGKLKVLDSIIKTYSPDQINQAVHDAEKGIAIKPVIQWP